ncbi:hypothetical protein KIN20_021457 [Parelaphostrongylus tenuis]|uniref:Uncharacterized protein n=1 Tax=Parelaphostrongylus tenuis TaxID=148309 RepID=A0AAD5MNY9_PARTN|nr:hypothetical protein KIN20_021450 [Parelaphostrongylus tenuis]KAJ1362045.1 hypothetical protein KIN20_021457 [Parelaphostrongylus tenuis]
MAVVSKEDDGNTMIDYFFIRVDDDTGRESDESIAKNVRTTDSDSGGDSLDYTQEASRCVARTGRTPSDVPECAWQLIVQQANVYGTKENYQWEYD